MKGLKKAWDVLTNAGAPRCAACGGKMPKGAQDLGDYCSACRVVIDWRDRRKKPRD